MIIDPDGKERYRTSGFLPKEDFLAELEFGLAKTAFAHKQWQDAASLFDEFVKKHPNSDLAPQALYWAGVSKYQGTHDHHVLGDTARAFQKQYTNSSWARRASVWAA